MSIASSYLKDSKAKYFYNSIQAGRSLAGNALIKKALKNLKQEFNDLSINHELPQSIEEISDD